MNFLDREQNYVELYQSCYRPFFDSVPLEYCQGVGGIQLAYRKFLNPNAHASILIVSGRTENMIKYAETIYDFVHAGFQVFAYDHRGQGESGRMIPDAQIGHVEKFSNYALDLEQILKTIGPQKKIYLVTHSMGGAVAICHSQFAHCANHNKINGYVFCSPMLRIESPKYLEALSLCYIKLKCLLGKSQKFYSSPGNIDVPNYGLDLTACMPRLSTYRAVLESNIGLRIGKPSFGWLNESISYLRSLAQVTLKAPYKLLLAGDDTVVDNKRVPHVFTQSPKVFEGVRHELFMADDVTRNELMTDIISFCKEIQAHELPKTHL